MKKDTTELENFYNACANGDIEKIKSIFNQNKTNARFIIEKYPILTEVTKLKGNIQVFEFLLQNGANIQALDKWNWTVFHWATYNNDITTLEYFWKKYPSEVQRKTGKGWFNGKETLLHVAVRGNACATLLFIVEKKVFDINITDQNDSTALHLALSKGCLKCSKILIEKGASLDVKNSSGEIPLHFAAKIGNTELLKFQKDKPIKLDIQDPDGLTSLHIAVNLCHAGFIDELLCLGANTEVKNRNGAAPFENNQSDTKSIQKIKQKYAYNLAEKYYQQHKYELTIKYLNLMSSSIYNGETALHFAAKKENVNLLLHLNNKDHVNTKDANGLTPLHVAVTYNNKEAVQTLIDWDVDTEVKNKNGYTAFDDDISDSPDLKKIKKKIREQVSFFLARKFYAQKKYELTVKYMKSALEKEKSIKKTDNYEMLIKAYHEISKQRPINEIDLSFCNIEDNDISNSSSNNESFLKRLLPSGYDFCLVPSDIPPESGLKEKTLHGQLKNGVFSYWTISLDGKKIETGKINTSDLGSEFKEPLGYDVCLMLTNSLPSKLEENTLYITIEVDSPYYHVMTPYGQLEKHPIVMGKELTLGHLKQDLPSILKVASDRGHIKSLEQQLKQKLPAILKITSERGHTTPLNYLCEIKKIKLNGNKITINGAISLANLVKNYPYLESIDLRENRISCVKQYLENELQEKFTYCASLKDIKVNQNFINPADGEREIFKPEKNTNSIYSLSINSTLYYRYGFFKTKPRNINSFLLEGHQINPESWVVNLVCKKGTQHAMIYMEGMHGNGQRFFEGYDIRTEGFVLYGTANANDITLSLNRFSPQDYHMQSKPISYEQGKKLQMNVKIAKQNTVGYSYVKKNCLTWCFTILKESGITDFSENLFEIPSKGAQGKSSCNIF